ncbi:hypothetical protein [Mangrovibacter plantisponsor]|jgi:hypothetical protein|uniref:Holin family HP1 protein n=1 Tax=Mangrovibacter plantisponsor TaxID=451513 RepID=A0A317PIB1_9ENTR|nr:hypothetical protein [Mangrovibacter plantisponsor]PWV99578.1 hypothetical protein DES37_1289 [Mangrovibacter plantisponsor]
MKMNDQPGNIVTQFFAWLAAIAAGLGLTTQDVVYMIFGLIGVVISLASYVNGRIDARRRRKEDEKRTSMIREYLEEESDKPSSERPAVVSVVADALKETGE